MSAEGLFPLGYISRAQGLDGALRFNTEYSGIIPKLKSKTVYLSKGDKQFSFLLVSSRIHDKESVVVQFKECNTRDMAEDLVGFTVEVERRNLPVGKGTTFYPYELEGMVVEDSIEGTLGKIEDVYSSPAHPVAAITHSGKEVLLPLAQGFINEIDRENGLIRVTLPAGLLEVYLQDGPEED